MATQNPQMTHKVAVVDEVRTRIGEASASIVTEYRGLTVAELAELPRRAGRRGGRLQDLQEHPGPPGHRRRRVPAAVRVPHRPHGAHLRAGRRQRGGQGAAGLRPGQPAPGHKGWSGRRLAALLVGPGALADLPPRDVLLARIAGALAAPLQQMAGLLQALPRGSRLRPLGPDRAEGGRRRGPAGRTRRPRRPRPRRPTAEAPAAESAAGPERGRGARGCGRSDR